ncbi:MAG: hypothetical protein ABEJ76_03250 [Halanaeroarchaeum sp.]
MKTCQTCGGLVTPDFVRVFGTDDGHVYACPNCVPSTALYGGEAARVPE